MKYVVGADVGTQSIKVQLYDQNMKLIASTNTPQYVETLKPMWATQKASNWWTIIPESIQKILKESGVSGEDVAAFGCCAHMHGAVPVKMDGTVLDNDVQLYCDKRGSKFSDELTENLTDLSGHVEEMKKELKVLTKTAVDIPVKLVTEISVLNEDQMKEICDAAADAKVKAVVISADFKPYDIPEPTIDQVKAFVDAAAGRFEVIGAGNVVDSKRFLKMLEAGVDRVNTTVGYEILAELN